MPHIVFEYSANMENHVDISALCEQLRLAALETGLFPLAGLRVRALRCEHYAIADGNADNGFIDISVRLRAGRTLEARKSATNHIFAAAETFLGETLGAHPVALSLEMRDIDAELSPKRNAIRNFLKDC